MASAPRWEYKVLPIQTRIRSSSSDGSVKTGIDGVENDLDRLGKEGWELVSVQDTALEDGRKFTVIYLKRQKTE